MKRLSSIIGLAAGSVLLSVLTAQSLSREGLSARADEPKPVVRTVTIAVAPQEEIPPVEAPVPPAPAPVVIDTPVQVPSTQVTSIQIPTHEATTDGLTAVDNAEMTDHHRTLTKLILGRLPRNCQEKLTSFSVLYDNPKHRGLAGRGVIILSGNVPDNEFIGLLVHEGLGHFADLTCFNGTPGSALSVFDDSGTIMKEDDPSVAFYSINWTDAKTKRASSSDADFVSGYAKSDVFEDFAESVAYYELQEEAFTERAQTNAALAAKLDWLRRYYPKSDTSITGADWSGDIPWDATKVAYSWTE